MLTRKPAIHPEVAAAQREATTGPFTEFLRKQGDPAATGGACLGALIGSSKFYTSFLDVKRRLAWLGLPALLPPAYPHFWGVVLSPVEQASLDAMMQRHIEMANFVVVIDEDSYTGEGTKELLTKVSQLDKVCPVFYLSKLRREAIWQTVARSYSQE